MSNRPPKGGLSAKLRDRSLELTKLDVYLDGEDDPREVAVPDVRKRWERVKKILDELPWTRVEAKNKKGEVTLIHKRCADDESAAGELESLGGGGAASGLAANISAVLGVAVHHVLRAQEVALTRHESATQMVLEQQGRLVDATMRRFESMDRQYNDMMRVNHALHGQRMAAAEQQLKKAAELAGMAPSESDGLIEQLLPVFAKAMLDKSDDKKPDGKPNGKPNGVAKAGA